MTKSYTKSPTSVDLRRLEERVTSLDGLLRTDGGGLRLVEVSADGTVRVRFNGLCVQCPLRPLTAASIVRPALAELPGVTGVDVDQVRISAEAQDRVARALIAG
jgi:Fe-S cluster biogenesis protein NfuA